MHTYTNMFTQTQTHITYTTCALYTYELESLYFVKWNRKKKYKRTRTT